MTAARVAYLNARLLDPASGLDTTGALLIEDGKIADFGTELFKDGAPSVSAVIAVSYTHLTLPTKRIV